MAELEKLLKRIEQMSTIGNIHTSSEKDDPKRIRKNIGEVIDEVSIFRKYAPNDAYKYFIQKIRCYDNRIIFRFCYYTLDSPRTGLYFGQYAIILDENEFKELLTKAKEKGFF